MNGISSIYTLSSFEGLKPILTRVGLKRFSCKWSKKCYSQHALFFLLLVKDGNEWSYRRLVREVRELGVYRNMGLSKVPHYTTLQKFCDRIKESLLYKLVRKLAEHIKPELVVGDGTGFSCQNPSHYYLSVIRRLTGKSPKIKSSVTTVLLIDYKTRQVLNTNTSHKKTHETKLVTPLLKELNCTHFIYDKALDSKQIRETLTQQGITPTIPYRENNKKKKQTNQETYRKRNIAESVISAIKRVYGSTIKNKTPSNQNKQATLKIINYQINLTKKNLYIKLTIYIISTEPY